MFSAVEPETVEFSTIQEMRPTIAFGFQDATRIRNVQSSRLLLAILVVTDDATSASMTIYNHCELRASRGHFQKTDVGRRRVTTCVSLAG